MIEYVEVRSIDGVMLGIVDTADSVIWHSVYFGVGDFEIYAPYSKANAELLVRGRLVSHSGSAEVGLIESVQYPISAQDGRSIVAAGRFVKSILDRRIIYKIDGTSVSPTILSGNVESAARRLVLENAVEPTDASRAISQLVLSAHSDTAPTIIDADGNASEKQVTHDSLLEYTDSLLEEYGLGATVYLTDDGKLAYLVYAGIDRSVGNAAGREPVIFSHEYDNLSGSEYSVNETAYKSFELIGGEGEGVDRFSVTLDRTGETGLARRETFVDASSIKRTYKDDEGTEQTLTDAQYTLQLRANGAQRFPDMSVIESFNGTIDLTNSIFVFGTHFKLGDIVTVHEEEIGVYMNVRITEATEVQDADGYRVDVSYKA